MKHGKNPTRAQKKLLERYKFNADNWLIVKDCSECLEVVHRITGDIRRLNRVTMKAIGDENGAG